MFSFIFWWCVSQIALLFLSLGGLVGWLLVVVIIIVIYILNSFKALIVGLLRFVVVVVDFGFLFGLEPKILLWFFFLGNCL